jgi:hypothetical protein
MRPRRRVCWAEIDGNTFWLEADWKSFTDYEAAVNGLSAIPHADTLHLQPDNAGRGSWTLSATMNLRSSWRPVGIIEKCDPQTGEAVVESEEVPSVGRVCRRCLGIDRDAGTARESSYGGDDGLQRGRMSRQTSSHSSTIPAGFGEEGMERRRSRRKWNSFCRKAAPKPGKCRPLRSRGHSESLPASLTRRKRWRGLCARARRGTERSLKRPKFGALSWSPDGRFVLSTEDGGQLR